MKEADGDVLAPLLASATEALGLLEVCGLDEADASAAAASLAELGREAAEAAAAEAPTIRTVHHFACTGGTLICKGLALQPNTLLLSEIDPLSVYNMNLAKPQFSPTDLILHLRYSIRQTPDEVICGIFLQSLEVLCGWLQRSGRRLILRDHAHSQFCVGGTVAERPDLRTLTSRRFPVRPVVTVRHPLDSYLALLKQGWVTFQPASPDEYARRYLLFLDTHSGTAIFRYEDFVADPETVMTAICAELALPFRPEMLKSFGGIRLTGDSGRSGSVIEARSRRPVPAAVEKSIADSEHFSALCARLGY